MLWQDLKYATELLCTFLQTVQT